MGLIERARALAKRYRESVSDMVAVLAEIDRLKAHATAGYPSLFLFCVKELLLAEDDAYRLIRSARASTTRPEILSYLASGDLSPRSVAVLAQERKAPDFPELLERSKGKSIREVEKLVAARHPQALPREQTSVLAIFPPGPGKPPPIVYRHSFNADEPLQVLIERAKDLLRHRHPDGKLEDVVREALEHLLADLDPLQRDPAAARPGARANPWARHVPPSVRDEVWRRDGGRCAFEGPAGRCGSAAWLELDHVIPWALGGRSDDPANLRLLCRAHNQAEARRRFGERAVF